jgi:hypothetical protein
MDDSIQLRTVRALSMVSAVVIVLDTTTTRVDSASNPVIGLGLMERFKITIRLSAVVIVLDTTTTRVDSGSNPVLGLGLGLGEGLNFN